MDKKFVRLVIAHVAEFSINIHFLDVYDEPSEKFTGTYGRLDEIEDEDHRKDIERIIEACNIKYETSYDNLRVNKMPEISDIPHIGEAS